MKRAILWNDRLILRAVFKTLRYRGLGRGIWEGFTKAEKVIDTTHLYSDAIEELERLIKASQRAQRAVLLKDQKPYHKGIQKALETAKDIFNEIQGLDPKKVKKAYGCRLGG